MFKWLFIGFLGDCGRLIGLPIYAEGLGADPEGSILKQRARSLMGLLTAHAGVEWRDKDGFWSGAWKLFKLRTSTPVLWWRNRQMRRKLEKMLGVRGKTNQQLVALLKKRLELAEIVRRAQEQEDMSE